MCFTAATVVADRTVRFLPVINIDTADAQAIAEAGRVIRAGGLVAFPTETVYGLGADATNDRAVAALFSVKQRPKFNPLIVHVHDAKAAARVARFDERAQALAAKFWPGPLTMVLPRLDDANVSWLASAGLQTIALRVPDHPVALAMFAAAGCPVVAPSANRSGSISPTAAEHVVQSLNDGPDLILDGGSCHIGVESTIISLAGDVPQLLRPGGIPSESIEVEIGPVAPPPDDHTVVLGPGMLESHYAPDRPVRMNATELMPGEVLLAFGSRVPLTYCNGLNLSADGDLEEAAANLFAMLRELDRREFKAIAVMPIPDRGLGRALNDRLRRAAAPRPKKSQRR